MPKADDIVEEWNHDYDVGQVVRVRLEGGKHVCTTTRSPAYLLGGHTPCVYVDAKPGCHQLTRVTPLSLEEANVRPA